MPRPFKVQSLLQSQYAAVGTPAKHALNDVEHDLVMANSREIEGVADLLQGNKNAQASIEKYTKAYQQYYWEVEGIDDLQLPV